MASTVSTVFVDDAVRGRLPKICARTGVPTNSILRVDAPVGGLGAAAWLLIFLGPIGVVILIVLAVLGTGRESIRVCLPYSAEAKESDQPWRSTRFMMGSVAIVAVLNMFVGFLIRPQASLVIAVGAALMALACHIVLYLRGIQIRLDGSRRWVTLSGVHPAFAAAVAEEAASQQRDTDVPR